MSMTSEQPVSPKPLTSDQEYWYSRVMVASETARMAVGYGFADAAYECARTAARRADKLPGYPEAYRSL